MLTTEHEQIRQESAQLEVPLSDLRVNDYDSIAGVFNVAMGFDFSRITFEPTLNAIASGLRLRNSIRHLDLACGTGLFICKLSQSVPAESIGIDLSFAQIGQAETLASFEQVPAEFIVGDIRIIPFPEGLDLVTCNFDSLNHITDLNDWRILFRKIRCALRRDGMFLFNINLPERLISNWSVPEVIVKPQLTYVQCGLDPEEHHEFVRRKIFVQVFSTSSKCYECSAALIEQIAVPKTRLYSLLLEAGFSEVQEQMIGDDLRKQHLFMSAKR
jgi:SAM-dependent methyltransferase